MPLKSTTSSYSSGLTLIRGGGTRDRPGNAQLGNRVWNCGVHLAPFIKEGPRNGPHFSLLFDSRLRHPFSVSFLFAIFSPHYLAPTIRNPFLHRSNQAIETKIDLGGLTDINWILCHILGVGDSGVGSSALRSMSSSSIHSEKRQFMRTCLAQGQKSRLLEMRAPRHFSGQLRSAAVLSRLHSNLARYKRGV